MLVSLSALAVLTACGSSEKTFTLNGNITLTDITGSGIRSNGMDCQGSGPYSDLSPGTAVLVADSTGKTIATGTLEIGSVIQNSGGCVIPFSVLSVKDGLSNYSVTVSHRGTQVVALSEAHAGISLTIGGNN